MSKMPLQLLLGHAVVVDYLAGDSLGVLVLGSTFRGERGNIKVIWDNGKENRNYYLAYRV